MDSRVSKPSRDSQGLSLQRAPSKVPTLQAPGGRRHEPPRAHRGGLRGICPTSGKEAYGRPGNLGLRKCSRIPSALASLFWADLREEKRINPALGFWLIFGPPGPTAGPGSAWNGSGSTSNARTSHSKSAREGPFVGTLCFLGRPRNI
jgi:hypothetical protein